MRIKLPMLASFLVASLGCSASNTPLAAGPSPSSNLGYSVSAVVLGIRSSPSEVALSFRASTALTASARLELGFADSSASLSINFSPASIAVDASGSGTLSAVIPEASDPRLGGRKPSSMRAAITTRNSLGDERTEYLSIPLS